MVMGGVTEMEGQVYFSKASQGLSKHLLKGKKT